MHWTARNNKVFNGKDDDSASIIRSAAADMEFEHYRIKDAASKMHLDAWREHLLGALIAPAQPPLHSTA